MHSQLLKNVSFGRSFHSISTPQMKTAASLTTDHSDFLRSCVITGRLSCVSSGGAAAGPRLNDSQLYKFSYATEVLVDQARGSKEGSVGYGISSDVDVNLVWRDPSNKDEQLIQLAVCRTSLLIFLTINTLLINLEFSPLAPFSPEYLAIIYKWWFIHFILLNRSQMWGSSPCPIDRRRRTSSPDQRSKAFWGRTNLQLWQSRSWCIWEMERWVIFSTRASFLFLQK